MKPNTVFKLLMALMLVLTLSGGVLFGGGVRAQEAEPKGGDTVQAALGTAFTYQGRLTDAGGTPVPGPCNLRFTLYGSASGSDQVGSPQTKPSVSLENGYFTVELDFGTGVFNGEGRYMKIEVDCGSGYTALSPRVKLNPTPQALALPGLYTQQNSTSPNLIGGYSGNSVGVGVVGATIGGGGKSGVINQVNDDFGTIGGGLGNTTSGIGYATIGGGSSNTSGYAATVGGGIGNTASGDRSAILGGVSNTASYPGATIGGGEFNTTNGVYTTIPGGYGAKASHYGQMAYANGYFTQAGDAQASVYVMRRQTDTGLGTWMDLYLDGAFTPIIIAPNRTLTFDILVVGHTLGGETAGYYIWGVAENVAGDITVWATVFELADEDTNWNAQVVEDDANDAMRVQVSGNGETVRWVATVRTTEVAW